jgi:hypothetical protein
MVVVAGAGGLRLTRGLANGFREDDEDGVSSFFSSAGSAHPKDCVALYDMISC